MPAEQVLAPGFKTTPYWWRDAPPRELPDSAVPAETDVAIVGSGYTGLSAALTLARAGRRVHVLEAENPGFGASTRNSGFVGRELRLKYSVLARRYGPERAVALAREAVAANAYVVELIRGEQIRCDYVACGRFVAAATPEHYEALARELALVRRHVGLDGEMVARPEQHREIGSDLYHGGMVLAGTGALHPGLYHGGLMDRVLAAGATVIARTPVTALERDDGAFTLSTPRGTLRAREVVLATNGYTGPAAPWFRRRVIPVVAGVLVTEPLAPGLLARLLPTARTMIDTKRNPYSCRPSPDGTRLQFAAARGVLMDDLEAKAREMHRSMAELFPDLARVRVEFCWSGRMGFSFDTLPHVGVVDGVHYAMGYCGSGVAMATYLGHKLAERVLGRAHAATAFDGRDFPTRPFYVGRPWFLPAVVGWYNLRDRLEARRPRAP